MSEGSQSYAASSREVATKRTFRSPAPIEAPSSLDSGSYLDLPRPSPSSAHGSLIAPSPSLQASTSAPGLPGLSAFREQAGLGAAAAAANAAAAAAAAAAAVEEASTLGEHQHQHQHRQTTTTHHTTAMEVNGRGACAAAAASATDAESRAAFEAMNKALHRAAASGAIQLDAAGGSSSSPAGASTPAAPPHSASTLQQPPTCVSRALGRPTPSSAQPRPRPASGRSGAAPRGGPPPGLRAYASSAAVVETARTPRGANGVGASVASPAVVGGGGASALETPNPLLSWGRGPSSAMALGDVQGAADADADGGGVYTPVDGGAPGAMEQFVQRQQQQQQQHYGLIGATGTPLQMMPHLGEGIRRKEETPQVRSFAPPGAAVQAVARMQRGGSTVMATPHAGPADGARADSAAATPHASGASTPTAEPPPPSFGRGFSRNVLVRRATTPPPRPTTPGGSVLPKWGPGARSSGWPPRPPPPPPPPSRGGGCHPAERSLRVAAGGGGGGGGKGLRASRSFRTSSRRRGRCLTSRRRSSRSTPTLQWRTSSGRAAAAPQYCLRRWQDACLIRLRRAAFLRCDVHFHASRLASLWHHWKALADAGKALERKVLALLIAAQTSKVGDSWDSLEAMCERAVSSCATGASTLPTAARRAPRCARGGGGGVAVGGGASPLSAAGGSPSKLTGRATSARRAPRWSS